MLRLRIAKTRMTMQTNAGRLSFGVSPDVEQNLRPIRLAVLTDLHAAQIEGFFQITGVSLTFDQEMSDDHERWAATTENPTDRPAECAAPALNDDLERFRAESAASVVGDSVDAAVDSANDEIYSQLVQHESRELARIEHALERIAQGTYGRCELCGVRIPAARLSALPYASSCIDCQRRHERATGAATPAPDATPCGTSMRADSRPTQPTNRLISGDSRQISAKTAPGRWVRLPFRARVDFCEFERDREVATVLGRATVPADDFQPVRRPVMQPFRSILFAADFSKNSVEAFRVACSLAVEHATRLFVLYVEPKRALDAPAREGESAVEAAPNERDAARHQPTRQQMRDLYAPFHPVDVEYRVKEGDPAEVGRLNGLRSRSFIQVVRCGPARNWPPSMSWWRRFCFRLF